MKNIIRILFVLSALSFPCITFGQQAMGTYEARCVGVSTYLTGDEGGLGNPDVTWKLEMEWLGPGLATITQLPEQCFHVDEANPLLNYNPPSNWNLSSGLFPGTPCNTRVYFKFVMSGFEKDFLPNNCDFDSFDDYGKIYTVRQNIGARVDQPNIWYPHDFIVRSKIGGSPLYKFKFEFKYSIDVMNGDTTETNYGGTPGIPNVVCEGDFYEVKARTFSGSNGYFVWQRRPVGSSTWVPHASGYGLNEISVQASDPGNFYQVRAISNGAYACLADPTWQQSKAPPAVIKRAPQFYEIEAFTRPACGTTNTGTVILIPYNYTPSGEYDILLVSQADTNQVISQENTTFPVTFNNVEPGYYKTLITRPGSPDNVRGQCTGVKENILVKSVQIPTPLSVTVDQHETCFGANDGWIRVVPANQTSPFESDTITLTGPVTQVRKSYGGPVYFTGLPPGNYTVVASRTAQYNQITCYSAPEFRTVNGVGTPLTATISHVNPSCAGERGSIIVSGITGGTPFDDGSYNIQYIGGLPERAIGGKFYSDLYPRPYVIRIWDANNCLLTLNADIIPPPSSPSLSLTVEDATACMPTGKIVASGSGGAPPYQYSLDEMNWQTTDSFPNLAPGYYRVYMRDDSLCTANTGDWVNSSINLSLNANQTGNTCADSATAQITTSQSGGVPDYTIELFKLPDTTNPVQTMVTSASSVLWDNLSAGAYLVRLTDLDDCVVKSSLVVQELATAYFTRVDTTSPECFDDALPPIIIEVSGRSAPISPVTNLEVSINGGSFQPTTLNLDNGATAIHEFTPDTLDGDFVVRDDLGCPVDIIRTFDRTRPDSVLVEVIAVDSTSCHDVYDGSMTFEITGAVKPYKAQLYIERVYGNELVYELITSEDTLVFSDLITSEAEEQFEPYFGWEGGYFLRITDNLDNPDKECITTSPISPSTNLYSPAKLEASGVAQAPLLDCMGEGGVVSGIAVGGTRPYEYSLDGQFWQSDSLLTGATDTNFVFVRDANLCHDVSDTSITIGFAPVPIAINSILTAAGSECLPQRDSIVLDGIDQGFFINDYSVLWNNCAGGTIPATNNEKDLINIISIGPNYLVVDNLIQNIIPAGCDTVVEGIMMFSLVDSNACIADIAVPIKVKNRLPRLSVTSKTGVTCSGDTDGSITVRVIDSLFDAGDAGSMKLSPPFAVTFNNEISQMVTTFPYEVTFSGIPESGFTISVSGARDCASSIIDSMIRLSPYDLDIVNSSVTGCGTDSTGGLSVTVNGGSNLPFTWRWYSDADMSFVPYGPEEILNVGETTTLSNLPVTTVRAIIEDINSCIDTIDFAIQGPNILALYKIDSTNLLCNNGGTGVIAVNALGGTLPIQYTIDGMTPQSDTVFTGLSAGIHHVQSIDANGCIDSAEFNLTEPPPILIDDITITETICFGDANGRIQVQASGGAGSLEYSLDAGPYQSSGDFPGLLAGTYTVTVKDADQCTLDTMNIQVPDAPMLSSTISISDSLSCLQGATLFVVANGGTPGYVYEWNGGASTTDTLNDAGPGQHIVRITDVRGCILWDTITLTTPDAPILSLTADTVDACSQSNGSFQVAAINGSSPYLFTANGSSNNTGYFNGLTANSYEVIVSDNNGCMDTLDVIIDSVGSPEIATIDLLQTTCAADNGQIALTIMNGSPPYQYTWSHDAGLNGPIATGLGVGNYDVTITDVRQCEVTLLSIPVTETAPPQLSITSAVNSACGQDNGMAVVFASGGDPGYTFSWSHNNTITGPIASNLAPATYTVKVTDQNGCKDSVDVIIGEDAPPVMTVVDSVDETCDLMNGSITLSSTGVNPPFIYTWSHNAGILDSMASGLSAGTYDVTVTDARNCTNTVAVVITNAPGPSISLVEVRNNQCVAGNGLIRVTSTDGALPVMYSWSHDNTLTDSVATDLIADSYSVTVTDQNGCEQVLNQDIIDQDLLTASVSNIEPTGCDTASGSIEITTTGGQSDYTYTWSHDGTLDTNYVDELATGSYTVSVTDMLGCELVLNATVTTAAGPTISLVSTTNSYCGPGMGSATMTASGGSLPYSYAWSHDGAISDSFAINLSGGGYSVTVTDANNCSSSTTFIIDQTTDIMLALVSSDDESCEANNGQITVSRSGGTNPITYSWSHNAGLNSPMAMNLSSGSYTVSVTDDVGCSATLTTVLDSLPSPIIGLITSEDNSCDQSNGSISTQVSGGNPAFTYTWSHDNSINGPDATDLAGGSYTLIVSDTESCADTLTMVIADLPVLEVSEINVSPTGCTVDNGSIIAGVSGGVAPFMYSWSHDSGLNDSIAMNLAEGSYTLIVADGSGCQDTLVFIVPMTPAPDMTLNSAEENECGQFDGQIIVDVADGTSPYTYTWSHDAGLNDSIANNLLDGTYQITVTDANGCSDTLTVVLTCETSLAIGGVDTINETCDLSNGSITVFPIGGTMPYSYAWSHDLSLNNPNANGLSAGFYTVTVTDNASSTVIYTQELTNSPGPQLAVVDMMNNNCPTAGNGLIVVSASMGLRPYSYAWSHDASITDSIAMDLEAGTYTIIITDAIGCKDTISQIILDEDLLTVVVSDVSPTSCAGPTGSITVTPTFGRPPYSYAWSHDAMLTDSTATNLAGGPYSITVSDVSNCQVVVDTQVLFTNSPTLSLVEEIMSSCGLENGSARVTATGGQRPFLYSWSHDGALTDSFATALPEGVYTVSVTDANGCPDELIINIGGSPAVTMSIGAVMNETCSDANGSIAVSVNGGTAPFDFNWSHDVTINDSTANSLTAGNYSIIITDFFNCRDTIQISLTNEIGPSVNLIESNNVSCAQANGTITIGVSDGTYPFAYAWSHDVDELDSIATDLVAGNYIVTVTDANNCTIMLNHTVGADPILDFAVTDNVPTACATDNGVIQVSGSGGVYPYTYAWSHDVTETDSIAENLGPGMYTVTITDSRDCEIILSAEVISANEPTLVLVESTSSTCGLANGDARVMASGGPSPFVYAWSHDATVVDSIASSLAEGTYVVSVTDANGCSSSLTIDIGGSPEVQLSVAEINQDTCDLGNGSISLLASGGTAPFTYSWSHDGSINGPEASDLNSGTYIIIVSDALMCSDTISVDISTTPEVMAIVSGFENNSCAQSNGSITVGVNSGTPPYNFSWAHDINLVGPTSTGLSAGAYAVVVTDANGCIDIVNHTVIDEPFLAVALTQVDSSNCDAGTGMIQIQVTGGSGAYTYTWSHDTTLNSNTATGLSAGNYAVTVTDARGCMVDLMTDVPEFNGPTAGNVIVMPTLCDEATGSIEVIPVGGLAPYSFTWPHDVTLTGPIATGLVSGVYEYQITDARNCTYTDVATVASSTDIAINLVSINRPACSMSNGSIEINTTGGVPPLNIEWFNANDLNTVIGTDALIAGLPAGTYVVNVSDADNCEDVQVYTLDDLEDMDVFLLAIDEICHDDDNGAAHANVVSGGTAPFTYQWDDASNSTTGSITGLDAGNYSVTVTDFNGCQFEGQVEVMQPEQIIIDTIISATGCLDNDNGSIVVNGMGGTGPLLYVWQDGPTGPNRFNLASGVYSLAVIDSTGCRSDFDLEVPAAEDITVTVGEIIQPACDGSVGGSATVDVDGGQSPYQFLWNDMLNQTGQTAVDLAPGSYRVTVTDQIGCSDTISMIIPSENGITITVEDVVLPACFDDGNGEIEVGVAGGSGNYSYLWDVFPFQMTARAVGLTAGQYIVRVTDLDLGCISRDTFILENPDELLIDSFNTIDINCFGATNGSAQVFASGGTGSLSYVWNDMMNQTVELAEGLVEGNYQVTVTDENLCSVVGEVMIIEPDEISVSIIDSISISCFGAADGQIKIEVEGGTAPYSIFWPELNVNGDSVTNLEGIAYTVQITDENGCMSEQMVSVSEPTAITIDLVELVNPACAAGQVGQITVSATGGSGVLQYLWDDDLMQITQTAFNLDSGTYSVVVTDENLCSDTMSYDLTGQAELSIDLIDSIAPLCFGDANGSLGVLVSGGNDDYIYSWNDPAFQMNPTAINLTSGEYVLFVSNGDGSCPTFDTLILSQPDLLVSEVLAVDHVLCFDDASGSISWDIFGGTEPYQIDWLEIGNDLGDSQTNLTAGFYNILITDNNGCTLTDSTEVSQPDKIIISLQENNPVCFGDDNGDIMANVVGGVSPYNYQWSSSSETTAQLSNLSAGNYTVSITDDNGCLQEATAMLADQSSEILLDVIESMLPSCVGADNGLLSISSSGGFGNLSYLWSNGISLPLNDMLLPDMYVVTITDELGCSLDTTFDLSQVTDLNVEIGFTDTLICQSEIISFGPDEIIGAIYSWSGPNGFTSDERIISAGRPGLYSVSVTASICMDTDEVTILNSNEVLQSHFILPTQIVVGDTIVILERSWPTPDELDWNIDSDSVIFVSQINDQWIYTFPYAGQFNIGLSAQFGDCDSYIEKMITVHPDSSTLVVPQSTGDKQILDFRIMPNPSTGIFQIFFELAQDMLYDINIYQIDGSNVDSRQGSGVGVLSEGYNLGTPANGLYVVTLQSGTETVWKILTIERP